MANIRGDFNITNLPRTGESHGGARKGFEQQWLRALEKTYFEKQIPTMQCMVATDGHDAASAVGDDSCQASGPVRILKNDGERLTSGSKPMAPAVFNANGNEMLGSKTAVEVNPGVSQKTRSPVGSYPLYAHNNSGNGSAPNNARPDMDLHAVRRMLPSSSLLTIVVSEDGFEVVIRDNAMDQDDVKRIIDKIRNFFAGRKQGLLKIMLNGHIVWERRPVPGLGKIGNDMQNRQQINKLYY